jgi:hypothetical protein
MMRFLAASALLTLAACGGDASSTSSPLSFNADGGNVSGTFNPGDWSSSEVKSEVSFGACAGGKIASYTETTKSNGMVSFVATCA